MDFTKRRYNMLKAGNEYIKSIGHIAEFCHGDINCQMKITWVDNFVNFVVLKVYVYSQQAFTYSGMIWRL